MMVDIYRTIQPLTIDRSAFLKKPSIVVTSSPIVQRSLQPRQVALLCKDDIQLYQMATRPFVAEE